MQKSNGGFRFVMTQNGSERDDLHVFIHVRICKYKTPWYEALFLFPPPMFPLLFEVHRAPD